MYIIEREQNRDYYLYCITPLTHTPPIDRFTLVVVVTVVQKMIFFLVTKNVDEMLMLVVMMVMMYFNSK